MTKGWIEFKNKILLLFPKIDLIIVQKLDYYRIALSTFRKLFALLNAY